MTTSDSEYEKNLLRLYQFSTRLNRSLQILDSSTDIFTSIGTLVQEQKLARGNALALFAPDGSLRLTASCAANSANWLSILSWLQDKRELWQDKIHQQHAQILCLDWPALLLTGGIAAHEPILLLPIFTNGQLSGLWIWIDCVLSLDVAQIAEELNAVIDDLRRRLDKIVSEDLQRTSEAKIEYLAYYDSLTGLPNRARFEQLLSRQLNILSEGGQLILMHLSMRAAQHLLQGLPRLDVDTVLHEIALRLERVLPSNALVGRVESTDFVVAVNFSGTVEEALQQGEVLARKLDESVPLHEQMLYLHPVAGVAIAPEHSHNAHTLMHAAELAAEFATRCDGIYGLLYSSGMDQDLSHQREMQGALRIALMGNEFVLHYQPQIDLHSGRLIGFEALLRWSNPKWLNTPIQYVVQTLESMGRISEVGNWVLREACRQSRVWQDQGLTPVRIAVNLSAQQFRNGDIVNVVAAALHEFALSPWLLELELTESLLVQDTEQIMAIMHELHALGVYLSIDDFGTGYSSLSYLTRFPVHKLKVDRGFVRFMINNGKQAAVVRAVLGLAHGLGLSAIAEGVETPAQWAFLSRMGCDEMQGYLVSKAIPASEAADLLTHDRVFGPTSTKADGETILFINNRSGTGSKLLESLHRSTFRVLTVDTPAQAFEPLAMQMINVVLCFQDMTGMHGVEFLQLARSIHPNLLGISIVSSTETGVVYEASNRGLIHRFLVEPVDSLDILHTVEEALELCRRRQLNSLLGG